MHKRKFVISITNAILLGKAFFTCQPQDAGTPLLETHNKRGVASFVEKDYLSQH